MMASWDIQDKTFIVTGGASGLGANYVRKFLQEGAKSIAVIDIAETQGKALVNDLKKEYPGKVTFIKCDMSKEDDIAKAFDEVVAKFKQVDVIINNAGVMDDSPEVWRMATTINIQGLVSLTLKGIKHMDKSEGGQGGTIVNISSSVALAALPLLPVYSASKLAVLFFSRSIATDPFYANTGVRTLCICFGPTDTPLLHNLEKRVYNPALGKLFCDAVAESGMQCQKIESAVEAIAHMLKNGTSGSMWFSICDKPVKDITPLIDQAFSSLEGEVYGNL